ncbi:AzlD domain-containing protein [Halomonas cupida]|uniref:AzlD domain-containing protein n=1 Tax=Halomonas cupida TaxID=44933 RepID=UPI0039B661B1
MPEHVWLAVALTALGTFLIRLLPLLWMQRRLARRQGENGVEALPPWLSILGPMMIAAMLGVSLIPASPSATTWLATLVGVIVTLLVWRQLRSLGWPVLAGVASYTAVILLARLFV